jgi:spermidine synthase
MKNFIYNEMMVHVGVCTNKAPENVLLLSENADGFVTEMKKHDNIAYEVISGIKGLREVDDKKYDVVISELGDDAAVLAHINRVLSEDGLMVMNIPSLEEVDTNTKTMQILGKYAKVIMPFRVNEGEFALLASKEYHPTADIILHRSDMLDNLNYYNCDVHPAAFAMGNNIRKAYLGIIKN